MVVPEAHRYGRLETARDEVEYRGGVLGLLVTPERETLCKVLIAASTRVGGNGREWRVDAPTSHYSRPLVCRTLDR